MLNRFFRSRISALALLLSLAAAFAWSSSADAAKRSRRKAPAAGGAADCKVDSDCVLVQDDCCSCNQGGKQHAIPKKDKANYEKDRKKRCGGPTMCTEVMSDDPSCTQVPFCGAGICELGAPPEKAP